MLIIQQIGLKRLSEGDQQEDLDRLQAIVQIKRAETPDFTIIEGEVITIRMDLSLKNATKTLVVRCQALLLV